MTILFIYGREHAGRNEPQSNFDGICWPNPTPCILHTSMLSKGEARAGAILSMSRVSQRCTWSREEVCFRPWLPQIFTACSPKTVGRSGTAFSRGDSRVN